MSPYARLALWWLETRPIRHWRMARKRKRRLRELGIEQETTVLNGKLTYAAQAGMAVVFVGQLLGVEITQEGAASVVGLCMALVGMYGRWRATK